MGELLTRCTHLFEQEALVICALVSRPSESAGKLHWVRTAQVRRDTQHLARIFRLQFVYPPHGPQRNFDDALQRLMQRGAVTALYDDGHGDRVQLLTTPQARRLVQLLRGMMVPLLDAYWVAALSFLPLQNEAEGGVLLKSHVQRMQRIANTMFLENKVHSTEAASQSSLLKVCVRARACVRVCARGGRQARDCHSNVRSYSLTQAHARTHTYTHAHSYTRTQRTPSRLLSK